MTVNSQQPALLEPQSMGVSAGVHETIAPRDSLYIPSLDGIRAVSFFLVFFAHAGLGATIIPGGFGVTIFFLLSGFLITTLLRMEFARYRRISLGGFYLRRVLRILPPLYISLILAMVLFRTGTGRTAIPIAGTISQVLQVSNYYQIYATNLNILPGTGVLWSLAVEEHFYLLFPLLYIWMSSRLSTQRQTIVLLSLCAATLAWRCILHFCFHSDFNRIYYATDTRFDSILFGCVFAVAANPILRDRQHEWMLRHMKWLVPLSILAIVGTFVVRTESFRDTLRYTVQGLALIPLFVAAIQYQKAMVVRFLNIPVMRFLGVLSYTLYLCHGMFMDFFDAIWPGGAVFLRGVASLICAICFATLVHYGIERPCTQVRKRLSKALKA